MSDRDLMGSSGSDDYQRLLAQNKFRDQKRAEAASKKLTEYQTKEKEKMRAMLADIGMADRYKIE